MPYDSLKKNEKQKQKWTRKRRRLLVRISLTSVVVLKHLDIHIGKIFQDIHLRKELERK